jgi:hypothetical protein
MLNTNYWINSDCQSFTTKTIAYRPGPTPAAIKQMIGYKFHDPAPIDSIDLRSLDAMCDGDTRFGIRRRKFKPSTQ